jgi:CRP-like cAMP-binding protein
MNPGVLGKEYQAGDVIVRQGEAGECMYAIQEGRAEVILESSDGNVRLGLLGEGDLFGEMAIFDGMSRSATVRALGYTRVVSIDKRHFLRQMHEDPSIAYRLLQTMSRRIRDLHEVVVRQDPSGATAAA